MKKFAPLLLLFVGPALAGPGPQPAPSAWVYSPYPTLGYSNGGIILPQTVTGGDKGVGTINVQGYFLNGNPLTAPASSIVVGNPITGGTPGGLLLNSAGNLGNSAALGTGVLPALTTNIGTAGAPVLFNGAGGTPSAINLANATNLPTSALAAGAASTNIGTLTGCLAGSTLPATTIASGCAAVTQAVTDKSTKIATTAALFAAAPAANAVMYGADPTGVNDSCAAFAAAKAAIGSFGTILIPSGYYSLSCQLALSNGYYALTGLGSGVTQLHFTSATAGNAGISFSNGSFLPLLINHMSIYSEVAQVNGNAAISVTYPTVTGTGPKNVTFDDLEIGYGNSTTAYWAYGILCANCTEGYASNLAIHGKNENNPPAGISTSNMIAGIALSGHSTAFTMVGANIGFANYGVYVKGDSEGSQQFACNFVGVNYGWYYDDGSAGDSTSIPQAPGPEIIDCNTATYKGGFVSKGWTQTTITGGSVFYKRPESTNNWVGVALLNGTYGGTTVGSNLNVVSAANQFYGFHGNAGTGGTATAVKLDTMASGDLVQGNTINYVDNAFDLSGGSGQNTLTGNQGYNFGTGWVTGGGSSSSIIYGNQPQKIGTSISDFPITAGATTFNVAGVNASNFATNNTAAVTITQFTNCWSGQVIRVLGNDGGFTTLQFNANMLLKGGVNVTLANAQMVTLECEVFSGSSVFREQARNF